MTNLKTHENWKLEKDSDNILWLSFDRKNAAVNSIDAGSFNQLDEIVSTCVNDYNPIALVIKSAKTKGFIAGADITQFAKLKNEQEAYDLIRQGQLILDKLAALPIPTIAMIDGFCLGGGMELALACRYRIATTEQSTKLGLPEVLLGIHPGWGGTIRMPQLIGAMNAMPLILSGQAISANAAEKIGLIDAAVPKRELERAARYYALNNPAPHRPTKLQSLTNNKFVRPLLGMKFEKELSKRVRKEHYPAPFAVIANWIKEGAVGAKAMNNEAKSIAQLMVTDTSHHLVRVFFLQERMKGLAKGIEFAPHHVHVIGAGTMGGDIAAWCALRGFTVTLQDRGAEYIAPAMKRAHALFKKKLKHPRLVQAALDRLTPDPNSFGVSKADVIIEAIFENAEAKQALFKDLELRAKADAILATNTSSIPLDEINKVMKNKERLIGIHFFNPVAKMQLVEVVKGQKTASTIIDNTIAFVAKIGRLPLPVKSSPGFLVNRVLMPYLMEAMKLYEEGIPANVIDKAALKFGMPMGPIELADTVGLDICLSVAEKLTQHYGGEVSDRLTQMVAKKQLGRKTGRGFYRYDKNGKLMREKLAKDYRFSPEIADRLVLRMLNEAVACLREGVIDDADLLDAGMIFGTGFAPFLGGPMHYAKTRGVDKVCETLSQFETKFGERFKADKGWQQLEGQMKVAKTTEVEKSKKVSKSAETTIKKEKETNNGPAQKTQKTDKSVPDEKIVSAAKPISKNDASARE